MIDIYLILETQRFHSKNIHISVKKQRNKYKGIMAATLAKKLNPQLAAKKALFKHLYLMLKQREQHLYGSKARSLSMKK